MTAALVFVAGWCPASALYLHTVDAVVQQTGAAITVIDVDSHPAEVQRHRIRAVPTTVITRGEASTSTVGAISASALTEALA